MRIGLLSDSHGRARLQASALRLLEERNVQILVHCGDLGSAECLEQLSSLGIPAYAVLGNTDQSSLELAAAGVNCGVALEPRAIVIPLEGARTAAATHGHDARLLHELIACGRHAYVFHGHTHASRDERAGGVRVINPGALCNSRHPGRPTVALLDTSLESLEWIDVPAKGLSG